jgi:hypothetical protein
MDPKLVETENKNYAITFQRKDTVLRLMVANGTDSHTRLKV